MQRLRFNKLFAFVLLTNIGFVTPLFIPVATAAETQPALSKTQKEIKATPFTVRIPQEKINRIMARVKEYPLPLVGG